MKRHTDQPARLGAELRQEQGKLNPVEAVCLLDELPTRDVLGDHVRKLRQPVAVGALFRQLQIVRATCFRLDEQVEHGVVRPLVGGLLVDRRVERRHVRGDAYRGDRRQDPDAR